MIWNRIRAWWLDRIDGDSVRPWVPWCCWAWLTWALLALIALPPVATIYSAMGSVAYWAWVWMSVVGNLGPIVGLWMRHGGSTIQHISAPLLLRDWMGLFFQAGGHAICTVLLFMFEISAVIGVHEYDGPNQYAGMTLFAAFMLLPWMFGSALLLAQANRKIQKGLRLERESLR